MNERRAGRTVAMVAFLLPVGYVAMLFALAVHEIVGHGLVAEAVGGEWRGFRMGLDGLGSARTSTPDEGRIAVLAGGLISTTVLGLLLLWAAWRVKRPLLGLGLGTTALVMFTEMPYGFWDAIWVGRRGDVGKILRRVDSETLRWLLVLGQGALYVLGIYLASLVLFRHVERLFGPLKRGAAWAFAGALVVGMAAGSFAFDWNRLIPGVDLWPSIGAVVLQAAIAVVLVRRRRASVEAMPVSGRTWTVALLSAWVCLAVAVYVVQTWLADGVRLV